MAWKVNVQLLNDADAEQDSKIVRSGTQAEAEAYYAEVPTYQTETQILRTRFNALIADVDAQNEANMAAVAAKLGANTDPDDADLPELVPFLERVKATV